jgi:hypothetical protein
MFLRRALPGLLAVFCVAALANAAQAQGLLWSLPEDGSWVRFEGPVVQTEIRPDAASNDRIEWLRHVTVKSVGKEMAEFEGESVPCRWIEIKVVTGKASEKGIEAGPVGTQIVKALVPESRINGKALYGDAIPASYVPIVKGFRKYGQGEVQKIDSNVLQIYPLLSPLMHYRTVEAAEGDAEDPMAPIGALSAKKHNGKSVVESFTTRTDNAAELWLTDEVPFGLAKWNVKQTRFIKDRAQSRDKFTPVSELEARMAATAKGTDAQSELEQQAEAN